MDYSIIPQRVGASLFILLFKPGARLEASSPANPYSNVIMRNYTMATKRTSALFLGLALTAIGTSASAGNYPDPDYYDYKSLPGATCHSKYGYEAKYFERDYRDGSIYHIPYYEYPEYPGGDFSESSSSSSNGKYHYDGRREVICPILRDNYKDHKGMYAGFWVKSNDHWGGGYDYNNKLECTLYSSSPTIAGSYEKVRKWTGSSHKERLEFHLPWSEENGSYYFHCYVPEGGRLYYYFYKEETYTDRNS